MPCGRILSCRIFGAGFVALIWNAQSEPRRPYHSGCQTEELANGIDFAWHAGLWQDAVAATDHAHKLEASHCRRRSSHTLKSMGWPDDALKRTVIRSGHIVEIP